MIYKLAKVAHNGSYWLGPKRGDNPAILRFNACKNYMGMFFIVTDDGPVVEDGDVKAFFTPQEAVMELNRLIRSGKVSATTKS